MRMKNRYGESGYPFADARFPTSPVSLALFRISLEC